jgi:hypothetical protein
MSVPFSDALDRLSSRFEVLKTRILEADALETKNPKQGHLASQSARAEGIIFGMAELEALVKNDLTQANSQLNSLQISYRDAKPCLRQLGAHSIFESLRSTTQSDKVWEHRARVTGFETSSELLCIPATTVGPQPPLDGKTLTPPHISRIVTVYGLADLEFASSSWQGSLYLFRSKRNDLAHGNITFGRVFQEPGMTPEKIVSCLADLEDLASALTLAWTEYFSQSRYLNSVLATV